MFGIDALDFIGALITMATGLVIGYFMGRDLAKGAPKSIADLEASVQYRQLAAYGNYRLIQSFEGVEFLKLPNGVSPNDGFIVAKSQAGNKYLVNQ